MLNGGSAKTSSIDPDSTPGKASRQSPEMRRSAADPGRSDFISALLLVGRRWGGFTVAVVIDPELGELLVQGIAVDAEAGGGLDLDALAGLQHLLDQFALDLADDPAVEVAGARAGGADALAGQP